MTATNYNLPTLLGSAPSFLGISGEVWIEGMAVP